MPQTQYPSVLLFGAPGVGKGTQGKILHRIPGFFHIASGDTFRDLDVDSPIGQEVREYTSRGELVPDDLTIRVWKKCLDEQIINSAYRPDSDLLVLDGIPRNVHQAELLREHVDVRRVVYLVVSNENVMVRRIRKRALDQGRDDDADEAVIRHRFEVYRDETKPVLECYSPELICEVDALPTPAEVLRSILDCVIPVQRDLSR